MSAKKWKILIVGLGAIGQRHVRVLKEILGDKVELLAYRVRGLSHVITPKFELDTSTTVEEKYGIRSFKDLNQALAQKPDAVFICNPSALHVPPAQAAADAGIPVFMEKPLSDSWEGVDKLLETVEKKKLVTMMAMPLRFHPCLEWIKAQLDSGRIGLLQSAEIWVHSFLAGLHPYEKFTDTYIARKDLGGGVLLTEIHEIDYALSLLGLPRRVMAVGGTLGPFDIDVEDTATLLWECEKDGRVFPVQLQMSMVQQALSRGCRISGTKGQILWDPSTSEVKVFDADKKSWQTQTFPAVDRFQLFLNEVRHFLESVEKGVPTKVDFKAGADGLKIVLAAKKSMESGSSVEMVDEVLCR